MKNNLTLLRASADILILFSIFLLPWWSAVFLILCALYFFDTYFEVLFFGFLMDSLYSPATGVLKYIFIILSFVAVNIKIFAQEYLRM